MKITVGQVAFWLIDLLFVYAGANLVWQGVRGRVMLGAAIGGAVVGVGAILAMLRDEWWPLLAGLPGGLVLGRILVNVTRHIDRKKEE